MLKTIEKKPLEELVKLRADLDKLIKKRQRTQKKELKKKFQVMAKEQGLTVDEVLGTSSPKKAKKGGKAPIKYKKDENTWAGRGRKPAWVNELIEKGENLDDYLVEEEGLELNLDFGEDLEGQETKNG